MQPLIQLTEKVAQPVEWGIVREMTNQPEKSDQKKWIAWIKHSYQHWMLQLLLVLLLLGAFLLSTWFSWLLDRMAAPLDAGMLSVLLYAVLVTVVFKLLTSWLCAGMVKPLLNKITPWQRTCFYGCLYLSYFWALVLVFIAVL